MCRLTWTRNQEEQLPLQNQRTTQFGFDHLMSYRHVHEYARTADAISTMPAHDVREAEEFEFRGMHRGALNPAAIT